MKEKVRWGILGPGRISRKFASALAEIEGAAPAAVGSRSLERAEEFASEFGFARTHGSYEELARDDGVDAVYIGTPHSRHREDSILCLQAGRHVLCEKPFAINAGEAEEMIAASRKAGRVLMEAMWMRFMPSILKVRDLVEAGRIGDVMRITADFGFRAEFDPGSRLFDPALGGGALLDVGVYPVSLAYFLLGEPSFVGGAARFGSTGVDEEGIALLGYEDGAQAVLTMALRLESPRDACILGTDGSIWIPEPWWKSERITLRQEGRGDRTIDLPRLENGFIYQAEEMMKLIREGRTESAVMPLEDSLAVMRIMDRIRERWELRYPMEGPR
jgi:predicted dehydrogenase